MSNEKDLELKEKKNQLEQIKTIMDDNLKKLTAKVKELNDKIIPSTGNKIKEHFLVAIIVSFATGFLTGIILLIIGRFNDRKK